MSFINDKERFLAVATPDEWDWWLTERADEFAKRLSFRHSSFDSCLFCHVFKINKYKKVTLTNIDCRACMGGKVRACLDIPDHDRIDRAIVRLEKAGVWEGR